jgi:hypothetical protein
VTNGAYSQDLVYPSEPGKFANFEPTLEPQLTGEKCRSLLGWMASRAVSLSFGLALAFSAGSFDPSDAKRG